MAKNDKKIVEDEPENVTEVLQYTTLHGARFLTNKSIFRRLFWAFCLLGAAGYCVLQHKKSVEYFTSKPFSTIITTKKEMTMKFPAVTFCNLNGIHTGKFAREVKKVFPNTTDEELKEDLKYLASSIVHSLNTNHFSTNNTEQATRSRIQYLIGNLSRFVLDLEDVLLPGPLFPCKMMSKKCGTEHFETASIPRYLRCFTFKPSEAEAVNLIGMDYGLRLRINVGADWYLPDSYEPFVGLNVLVHPRDEYPYVDSHGFFVEPGTHTSCAIRRREIVNLPYPYVTDCGEKELKIVKNSNYSYSRTRCLRDCYFERIMEECHCKMDKILDYEFPVCDSESQVFCTLAVNRKLTNSPSYLDCQRSCKESCKYSTYKTRLSRAHINTKAMVDDIHNFCRNDKHDAIICQEMRNKSQREKSQYISENIVSLDVYLEDFYYDEIKQVPVFEWFELISDLGGNLGLFLGMSVLTLAEFIDYIIRIIWYKLRMIGKSKTTDFKSRE